MAMYSAINTVLAHDKFRNDDSLYLLLMFFSLFRFEVDKQGVSNSTTWDGTEVDRW